MYTAEKEKQTHPHTNGGRNRIRLKRQAKRHTSALNRNLPPVKTQTTPRGMRDGESSSMRDLLRNLHKAKVVFLFVVVKNT